MFVARLVYLPFNSVLVAAFRSKSWYND